MGTKHTDSCLKSPSLGDDEPIFVIRARDVLSTRTVLLWADMLDLLADHLDEPAYYTNNLKNKADQARVIANSMKTWRAERGGKIPD